MTAETIEKIKVTGAGLTLSRLIWNRFQAPAAQTLGKVYDLNPGLAAMGTHIPIGAVVMVPIPDPVDDPVLDRVTLWT